MARPQRYGNNLQRVMQEVDDIVKEVHADGKDHIKYLPISYVASRLDIVESTVRGTGFHHKIGRERDGAKYVPQKGLEIEVRPYLEDINELEPDNEEPGNE